jgi:hypothetical protein
MSDEKIDGPVNFGTVSQIIEMLEPLTTSDREHVLQTVATWLRIGPAARGVNIAPSIEPIPFQSSQQQGPNDDKFSNRPELSVKEFVFEKNPTTEAERVACLAYYMTHYLDMPHFKNIDLSRLNTEAAQRKLSNPGVAANNAMRDGFFVQATKNGYKQLSAMGERFVQLLPDREAALKVRQRKSSRQSKQASGKHPGASEEDSKISSQS